jgi:hypothetical protein
MASGAKKKTTMAKLMRENRLRERRFDKQAKKDARKLAPAQPDWDGEPLDPAAEPTGGADEALLAAVPAPTDA